NSYLDAFGAEKENYRIYIELWVENETQTAFEKAYDSHLPLKYGSSWQAETDLKYILHGILENAGVDYIGFYITAITEAKKSARKFYLKFGESIDNVVGTLTQTANFNVVYGGLSYSAASATSLLNKLQPVAGDVTKDKFLKQGILQEYTRSNQPQFLYFLNTRAAKAGCTLQAKFYFTNTTVLQKTVTTGDIDQYRKYAFNTRFNLLISEAEIAGRICSHYEVWLQDSAVAIISEKRDYYLNYEIKDFVRYFLYWSSWGSVDTLYTYGKGKTGIELSQTQSGRIYNYGADIKQGQKFSFDISLNSGFKVATGFASKKQIGLNRDFYLSPFKLRVFNDVYLPISLSSKSIDEFNDGEGLFAQLFEYKYDFEDDAYTEGDEDEGIGDSLASFTIGSSLIVIPPTPIDLTPYLTKAEYYADKAKFVSGENATKTTLIMTLLSGGILDDLPTGAYTVPNTAIQELIPSFSNPAAYTDVLLVRHVNAAGRLGYAIISCNDLANDSYMITFASVAGAHKITKLGEGPEPVAFSQSSLVPDGSGSYKLPITVAENKGVSWIRLNKSGSIYMMPIVYENGFLLGFDDNTAQTILVKIT
ncbi:MAG: hypothetical protein H7202_13015, partial [Pedobacter sp.]|nr:hypothetical protein [Pedobacter sp.]